MVQQIMSHFNLEPMAHLVVCWLVMWQPNWCYRTAVDVVCPVDVTLNSLGVRLAGWPA